MRTQSRSLYEETVERLAAAQAVVAALDASDEVKAGLHAHVRQLARAAKSDLTRTSRRVDELTEALRSGMLLATVDLTP